VKSCYIYLFSLALIVNGCVTKKAAEAQARAAFAAGERKALMSMPPPSAQGLNIIFKGDVQNPMVPWTPEMTLAKAIVAAGYNGPTDPTSIIIVRNGKAMQVDPRKLLKGEDVPLQPLDIVALAVGPGPISSGSTSPHTPSPSER
jgi:hypothetical protein